MKQYILYIGWLLCFLTACTDEELVKHGNVGDKEVWITLKFNHTSFDKIDISTRATMNDIAESRVENLFVFVFDNEGNKVYSHYYDSENRMEYLPSTPGYWWSVFNRTSQTSDGGTWGEVMIKAPVMSEGSIYLIANLNADQLNISADQLNLVEKMDDLEALTITMNQEITSRTGYFLMTGSSDNISVDETGSITKGGDWFSIPLMRLDAKVTVNVKVKVGATTDGGQSMQDFIPESWQIMKLPKGTQLLAGDGNADHLGFFDSPAEHFEESRDEGNDKVKSFSFYMLENKKTATGLTSYNEREKRKKKADGSYDTSNGMWLNVSDDATYMVIKGKVQMTVDTDDEFGMQYLEADVTYYVHLGNFGKSTSGGNYNDFTVNRNTHYTYDITINGVNNIELEVTTGVENQSGATGHVYKSREETYTFDAHYGQRVFRIDADRVLNKTVTWYVKTPFSEGTPGMESGTQVPNLDYRWVWFMVNEISDGKYSRNNRIYPGNQFQAVDYNDPNGKPDELMNVVELTNFIKNERDKLANGDPTSAFKYDDGKYWLYVTAFVDEYYYEAHPLNASDAPQDLWKKFVNKPNRVLHVLCDSELSLDEESSVTNSVITIRQRSIQTPYNLTKASLKSAFGCETVDETREDNLTFYENDDNYVDVDLGNNSTQNGLYNTACLWNLFDNEGKVKTGANREKWETYLDYKIPNRETGVNHFMLSAQKCMRYAPMSRNRDNNGNGYIDPEEIRWYIAPLEQLYALYVGDLGLVSDAWLYPPSLSSLSDNKDANEKWQWRNHIVCSNRTTIETKDEYVSPHWPEMLWAEEGVSISGYGIDNFWGKPAPYSIRCIRNLGMEDASVATVNDVSANVPTPMINVSHSLDGNVYKFDLSNVNDRSVRYYTTKELMPENENNEASRIYYGFETYHEFTTPSNFGFNYYNLKIELENARSLSPAGYRIPNVREAALMSLYCPSDWWGNNKILSCSYYSHGGYGDNYDEDTYTWIFMNKYITLLGLPNCLRCVRDWNPTTN